MCLCLGRVGHLVFCLLPQQTKSPELGSNCGHAWRASCWVSEGTCVTSLAHVCQSMLQNTLTKYLDTGVFSGHLARLFLRHGKHVCKSPPF